MRDLAGPAGAYFERYGRESLASVPDRSLVLSTTDINWNSMRYLQACEGVAPAVTHVSLQIYPFTWFQRQHRLYPGVNFPEVLEDASMQKGTEGHTRLLGRFLHANVGSDEFPGGVYLDLHGIRHTDLATGNVFHGFRMWPHGLLWRVEQAAAADDKGRAAGLPSNKKFLDWRRRTATAETQLRVYDKLIAGRPPEHTAFPGSWEEAAQHIAIDAVYQRALFEISHAVGLGGAGWLLDTKTSDDATKREYLAALQDGNARIETVRALVDRDGVSSGLAINDVIKNHAVSSTRLSFALASALDPDGGTESTQKAAAALVAPRAIAAIRTFRQRVPSDPSNAVFARIVPVLEQIVGSKPPAVAGAPPGTQKTGENNNKKKKKKKNTKNKKKKKKKKTRTKMQTKRPVQ